ncbi:MAG: gamma-glutamyltransferase, partial [Novosphingobium sp.]|nr:gamma-glutamyltransferase [Novosphingobium sp.]
MPFRLLACLFAPLLLAACATTPAHEPLLPKGVVSAADPRAAEAGAQMLRNGGTATDAAIATMLALTVVEPQ